MATFDSYQGGSGSLTITAMVYAEKGLNRLQAIVNSWWFEKRRLGWRAIFNFTNFLRLLWLSVVWWGELGVFNSAMSKCAWEKWEDWPAGATPTRISLVADPQLVDWHTYKRPAIAMAATIFYSDLYLGKVYRQMLRELKPSTVLFLGDLFDGGREWDTADSGAKRAKGSGQGNQAHYNNAYWKNEYERFQNIFPSEPGVLTIKSLPGNHDLGFGKGIKPAVRDRFTAFFGDPSSVWEIGNHTFVLLDTVSMSDDRQDKDGLRVGRPAKKWFESYVNGERHPKARLPHDLGRMSHTLQKANEPAPAALQDQPKYDIHKFPTILLTHVPLYRVPKTYCGPLREISHPKEGLSIPIYAGYQYQNVLNHDLSRDILKKLSPQMVFSGDDHDYCVVEHAGVSDPGQGVLKTGRWGLVKEITVKSISWTMGVRKPGFVTLSLWNPQDKKDGGGDALLKAAAERKNKKKALETEDGLSIQTHLCLLPDQLGIFIFYAILFGFSLLALVIRSLVKPTPPSSQFSPRYEKLEPAEESILPISKPVSVSHLHGLSAASATSKLPPTTRTSVSSMPNSRASSPRPNGYGYTSSNTANNTVSSPSESEDEKDKYRKEGNWLAASATSALMANPTAAATVRQSAEAGQKLVNDGKRWWAVKSFAIQKLLQRFGIGRRVVKGWRSGNTGHKSNRSCLPCGACTSCVRVIKDVFKTLVGVGIIIIPIYIWILLHSWQ